MKCSLIILLMVSFSSCFSQAAKEADSVQAYVNKLDWTSFTITNEYVSSLSLKDDALRLVKLKDGSKINRLLSSIENPEKTVFIHVILTKIFEPEKEMFSYKYSYGKDSTVQCVLYQYNDLAWKRDERYESAVNPRDITAIKEYWRHKILRN